MNICPYISENPTRGYYGKYEGEYVNLRHYRTIIPK